MASPVELSVLVAMPKHIATDEILSLALKADWRHELRAVPEASAPDARELPALFEVVGSIYAPRSEVVVVFDTIGAIEPVVETDEFVEGAEVPLCRSHCGTMVFRFVLPALRAAWMQLMTESLFI